VGEWSIPSVECNVSSTTYPLPTSRMIDVLKTITRKRRGYCEYQLQLACRAEPFSPRHEISQPAQKAWSSLLPIMPSRQSPLLRADAQARHCAKQRAMPCLIRPRVTSVTVRELCFESLALPTHLRVPNVAYPWVVAQFGVQRMRIRHNDVTIADSGGEASGSEVVI